MVGMPMKALVKGVIIAVGMSFECDEGRASRASVQAECGEHRTRKEQIDTLLWKRRAPNITAPNWAPRFAPSTAAQRASLHLSLTPTRRAVASTLTVN